MSGEAPLDDVGVVEAAGVFGEAATLSLVPNGEAAVVLLSGLTELL